LLFQLWITAAIKEKVIKNNLLHFAWLGTKTDQTQTNESQRIGEQNLLKQEMKAE